jgi:hypothetical protein
MSDVISSLQGIGRLVLLFLGCWLFGAVVGLSAAERILERDTALQRAGNAGLVTLKAGTIATLDGQGRVVSGTLAQDAALNRPGGRGPVSLKGGTTVRFNNRGEVIDGTVAQPSAFTTPRGSLQSMPAGSRTGFSARGNAIPGGRHDIESHGYYYEFGQYHQRILATDIPVRLSGIQVKNGHLYGSSKLKGTWKALQREAEHLGGYLVCINSQGEQEWISRHFDLSHKWLGLSRPPGKDARQGWQWASGERSDFFFWDHGQPNNTTGREEFGMFVGTGSGRWQDAPLEGLPQTSSYAGIIEIPLD